jgi:ATP-dependent Lhr-like helicase
VRRGYFVAERGATQFALPGADDRLRARREGDETPRLVVVAATDPASPYGAILPWPARAGVDDEARRPQRAAGARVILYDGALLGWLSRGGDALLTFLADVEPARTSGAAALANALAGLVESGTERALHLATIDGEPAGASPIGQALKEAGFTLGSDGYLRRRSQAPLHGYRREPELPEP